MRCPSKSAMLCQVIMFSSPNLRFHIFFVTYEIRKLRRSTSFQLLKQSISESIKRFISIGQFSFFGISIKSKKIRPSSSSTLLSSRTATSEYGLLDSMKHSKAISLRSSNYLLMGNCNFMPNIYCCNFGSSGRVNYFKFVCACRFTFISALFG